MKRIYSLSRELNDDGVYRAAALSTIKETFWRCKLALFKSCRVKQAPSSTQKASHFRHANKRSFLTNLRRVHIPDLSTLLIKTLASWRAILKAVKSKQMKREMPREMSKHWERNSALQKILKTFRRWSDGNQHIVIKNYMGNWLQAEKRSVTSSTNRTNDQIERAKRDCV